MKLEIGYYSYTYHWPMPGDRIQQLKSNDNENYCVNPNLVALCFGQGQIPKGQVIVERVTSAALKNNGGENPTRRVTVYLPPNYNNTTNRYPVIYYLHGFTGSDSLQIAKNQFDEVLDKAIATEKIRPVIVVMPDQHTLFRGSWYSNSTLTGNWADFTAKDLVKFIDDRYRTIPQPEGRGISGHSMGGYGAIKIGMQFPHVFSSVYALSPGFLGFVKEVGAHSRAYKRAQEIVSREDLIRDWSDILPNALIAMGRTFSPNLDKPPFYADLPFTYDGEELKIDYQGLEKWNRNSPIEMADEFAMNLKKLKALKLDWGRNEEYPAIPLTCEMFSQKLENLGVNHYAEEYIGTHGNKLWTDDGRALNDMFPFFNTYLIFEELKIIKTENRKEKTK